MPVRSAQLPHHNTAAMLWFGGSIATSGYHYKHHPKAASHKPGASLILLSAVSIKLFLPTSSSLRTQIFNHIHDNMLEKVQGQVQRKICPLLSAILELTLGRFIPVTEVQAAFFWPRSLLVGRAICNTDQECGKPSHSFCYICKLTGQWVFSISDQKNWLEERKVREKYKLCSDVSGWKYPLGSFGSLLWDQKVVGSNPLTASGSSEVPLNKHTLL